MSERETTTPGVPLLIASISGRIGTGKSTEVKAAGRDPRVIESLEVINKRLLGDYIHSTLPDLGFTLQTAALHASVVRLRAAVAAARKTGLFVVIERDLFENMIFAVANRDAGKMTPEQFAAYLTYITEELENLREILAAGKPLVASQIPHHFFLWAPEGLTLQRMIQRGVLCEKDYDDDYLEHLAHCYFRGILESHLIPAKSKWALRRPYIMIDWTQYGDWETSLIRKVLVDLAAPALPTELDSDGKEQGTMHEKPRKPVAPSLALTLSTEIENELPYEIDEQDFADAQTHYGNVRFVRDDEEHVRERPMWMTYRVDAKAQKTPVGVNYHLDLAWYETQSIKTHKQGRASFRDFFCRSLIGGNVHNGKRVYLHWKDSRAASKPDYRHIYADQ